LANREALRKLSRKIPARPEIEKILDELHDKEDLHIAIVGTAIAEAHLETLITKKLKTKNHQLIARLFLNRGPLSDFDSKITVAEAFGLITPPLAGELHMMKAVRNAFAHAKVPLTFDHELIAREVSEAKGSQVDARIPV
jgi:hypothetical protein